jgi:hypothetical protein
MPIALYTRLSASRQALQMGLLDALNSRHARLVLDHFCFSQKSRTDLSFCFYAIPDAKPLRTFAGIALKAEKPGLCKPGSFHWRI